MTTSPSPNSSAALSASVRQAGHRAAALAGVGHDLDRGPWRAAARPARPARRPSAARSARPGCARRPRRRRCRASAAPAARRRDAGHDARLGHLGRGLVAAGRQVGRVEDGLGRGEPAAAARRRRPVPEPWPGNRKAIRGRVGRARPGTPVGVRQPRGGVAVERRRAAARACRPRPPGGWATTAARTGPSAQLGRPGARPGRPSSAKDSAGDAASVRPLDPVAQVGGVGGVEQQQLGVLAGRRRRRVRASSRRAGSGPGACSSAMWVLMPPKPIAETPARTGWPAGQGSASRGTCSGGVGAGQQRVRVAVAGGRRDHLVVHRQRGLDQPGDAGGGLGVADVALDRAERGRSASRVGGACGRRTAPRSRWRRRRSVPVP